jgi:hypothetical protein
MSCRQNRRLETPISAAECEVLEPDTSNDNSAVAAGERLFGGAKIIKHLSFIAESRSELSAVMTVIVMLFGRGNCKAWPSSTASPTHSLEIG